MIHPLLHEIPALVVPRYDLRVTIPIHVTIGDACDIPTKPGFDVSNGLAPTEDHGPDHLGKRHWIFVDGIPAIGIPAIGILIAGVPRIWIPIAGIPVI